MPRHLSFTSGNASRFPAPRNPQPRGFNLGGITNPSVGFPPAPARPVFRHPAPQTYSGHQLDYGRQANQEQQNFAPRFMRPRGPRRNITPRYGQSITDQQHQRRQQRPKLRQGNNQGGRPAYGYNQKEYEYQGEAGNYRGREKTNAIDVRGDGPLVKKEMLDHFSQFGEITGILMQPGGMSAVVTYSQPVFYIEKMN